MSNRTNTVLSCCAAMMAGGFTNYQLAFTDLATAPLVKAGVVGAVAAAALVFMRSVLPPRKAG